MATASGIDMHVTALAQRFPSLLSDLHQYVRGRADGVQAESVGAAPIAFAVGPNVFLVHATDAETVLARLRDLPTGRRLIQLFHSAAQLLQFVASGDFPACVGDERWWPWLMLPIEHTRHVQEFCQSNPPRDWPWPLATGVVGAGPATEAALQTGHELLCVLENMCVLLLQRINPRYASRPSLHDILAHGARPLRVLSVAGRNSNYQRYCARDIAEGLRANGVEARAMILESTPAVQYELLQEIEVFDPDVLFLNGRGRRMLAQVPEGLPVVSWDQDYCLATAPVYARDRVAHDHLLVMLKDWEEDAGRNGIPADHVTHVNMGTNLAMYGPPTKPVAPECDVLFVGNYFEFEQYRKIIAFDSFDEQSQRILLHARERLREWILSRDAQEPFIIPDLDAFLQGILTELNVASMMDVVQWRRCVMYVRYRLANALLRELYLPALTDFNLRVYGSGWDKLTAVAPYARPPIENGPDLRAATQRAAINLYLHSWTVHHPRLYDTAAAEGFQLVARLPEAQPLDRVFDPLNEVDTFGSIAELKVKIRYYLAHPEVRIARAQRASARARRDHGMSRRMAQVLEVLRNDVHDKIAPAATHDHAAAAVPG